MHGIEFPLLLLTVSHRRLSTWTWTDSFHRHGHHVQTRINWHIGHSPHDSISFCAVHFVVRVVFLISALANCTSLRSILHPVLVVLDRKREQRLMLPDILHLHPSPKSVLGPSVYCTCKYSWTPCRRHIDCHIVVIPEGAINRHKTTDDEAWQRTWDVVTIQQLLPILCTSVLWHCNQSDKGFPYSHFYPPNSTNCCSSFPKGGGWTRKTKGTNDVRNQYFSPIVVITCCSILVRRLLQDRTGPLSGIYPELLDTTEIAEEERWPGKELDDVEVTSFGASCASCSWSWSLDSCSCRC